MKYAILCVIAVLTLLGLSGCTSNSQVVQLRNQTMRQSLIIQRQQRQIAELQAKLESKQQKPANISLKHKKDTQSQKYTKPKQNIKLKKVEDTNYNSDYMYPDDKKTKSTQTVATATPTVSMNKAECVTMIGEAKFERYTQMFGGEAAAIKRCAMIRAMKK